MNKYLEEFDETARLILMDQPKGLIEFSDRMRDVHPNLPRAGDTVVSLWQKYRGFDGRSLPTHDYMTGERFRKM